VRARGFLENLLAAAGGGSSIRALQRKYWVLEENFDWPRRAREEQFADWRVSKNQDF